MPITLPPLPWPKDALAPTMVGIGIGTSTGTRSLFARPDSLSLALRASLVRQSEETLDVHYGKHHAAYVNNLNGQIKDTDMDSMDVVEIMNKSWNNGSPTPTFNNAAQVLNHTFFWESMAPNAGGKPTGDLAAAIDRDFGSFDEFKAQFSAAGATQFGSGWAWLSVNNETKKLEVSKTANAENPWVYGTATPILTMDVWEHAYYIDVRNRRPDYIASFFDLINWNAVADRYAKCII